MTATSDTPTLPISPMRATRPANPIIPILSSWQYSAKGRHCEVPRYIIFSILLSLQSTSILLSIGQTTDTATIFVHNFILTTLDRWRQATCECNPFYLRSFKEPVKVRDPVFFKARKPRSWCASPFVGCRRLLMQQIRRHPPHAII
jgi:hypothetical protein